MSKNSVIRTAINKEIKKLQDDLKKIDIERLELHEQTLDWDNRYYTSSRSSDIEQNKITALIGAKQMLENEIELYKNAFTNDMIANLDYVSEEYNTVPWKGKAYSIIRARVDIVRFQRSGISENDYNRDTEAIFKKMNQVFPFLCSRPIVKIPMQEHIILKRLIHGLTEADMRILGFLRAAEEGALPPEAIKFIVETISSLKKLPRGQNSFDDMWTEYILGDTELWKSPK